MTRIGSGRIDTPRGARRPAGFSSGFIAGFALAVIVAVAFFVTTTP